MSALIAAFVAACSVMSAGAAIQHVAGAAATSRTTPGAASRFGDSRASRRIGGTDGRAAAHGRGRARERPAGSRTPAARAMRAAGVVAVLVVLDATLAALAGGGLLAFWSTRRWRARRRRRGEQERAAAALPDAVDVLISCLQAGQTPLLALDELSRRAPPATRPAWQAAADRLHRGDGFADAITELVRCCGAAAVPVVAALAGGVRDGLPLLPLLDRLTLEADARRRRGAEAEARKLPVRLSFPLVCCTLPAFVLLAIAPALLGALSGLQLPT